MAPINSNASACLSGPTGGGLDPGAQVRILIIYASPERVWRQDLSVQAGTTASEALAGSRFAQEFPNYPYDEAALGIFGQLCTPDHCLADGDRLEIYRSLVFDPLESRRRRAEHRKAFMTKPKNRPKRRKAKLAAQERARQAEVSAPGLIKQAGPTD
ncbi:MAG: RnfH family protein [Candidimonas sp.]|nr:MAG: RnfH family protein [Candidimonas sp.]TAM26175.1 MAG: RnfH family protein [Candidimonas sp.]TAM77007.1 MAG: RnfH family protein [Candidimonas sp.]